MFNLKVFSSLFVCLLAVCGNSVSQTNNPTQPQQSDKPELTVIMKRNACVMGLCPVYELTIQPDGKVIFEGIQNTETKGKVESNLSIEKISQLTAEINKADFFSLKDSYAEDSGNCPQLLYDSSSVMISIKIKGKEKKIEHFQGCYETFSPDPKQFPQQLFDLEIKIDELVETKRWVGEGK